MSGRFRVTLPPSYHFQNSLQDEQPYFYVSLDDHLKFHIHYMFLVFLAWLIRARIYHVHQNFLVEIAAMDILEDHSLRKVGRDSYSCFERIELSNIIACNFLLWTHVWDSCFFFFSFSYSIHTLFSTTLCSYLPPALQSVCAWNPHLSLRYENHHHFVERVFQQNCALWSLDKKEAQ